MRGLRTFSTVKVSLEPSSQRISHLLPVVHPRPLLLCLLDCLLGLGLGAGVLEPALLEEVLLQPLELARVLPEEGLEVALPLLVLPSRELEHVALPAVAGVRGGRLGVAGPWSSLWRVETGRGGGREAGDGRSEERVEGGVGVGGEEGGREPWSEGRVPRELEAGREARVTSEVLVTVLETVVVTLDLSRTVVQAGGRVAVTGGR